MFDIGLRRVFGRFPYWPRPPPCEEPSASGRGCARSRSEAANRGVPERVDGAVLEACSDELAACEFFENQRWGETGYCCPGCGDTDVYKMTDRKTRQRNRRFLWMCKGWKKQYTVCVGTVLEESLIPLRHWAYGFGPPPRRRRASLRCRSSA